MNGYVHLQTTEGDPIIVNADRVNLVRRFRGGNEAGAVNFKKGSYIVVKGRLEFVVKALEQGSHRSVATVSGKKRS